MNPELSVVIPLFNKGQYIERTLNSVLGQSLRDLEVIVIDDGSTDDGPEKVRRVEDPRVRLISQANRGVSAARNRGIGEARSGLIALLDADDQWHGEYLAQVVGLKNVFPQARVFACAAEIVRPGRPNYVPKYPLPERSLIDLTDYMQLCIKIRPPLSSSSVVAEKALYEQIGGFPVDQARGEDIDTWFRLIEKSPCAFLNKPLIVYWANLPGSACLMPNTPETSSLESDLEDRIARGDYDEDNVGLLRDFLAWRKFGRIRRMVQSGDHKNARADIIPMLKSKRFRLLYLELYLKSLLPRRELPNLDSDATPPTN